MENYKLSYTANEINEKLGQIGTKPSWNDLTDKPFYSEMVEGNATFDGDLTGREYTDMGQYTYVKMSDIQLTKDDLIGSTLVYTGTLDPFKTIAVAEYTTEVTVTGDMIMEQALSDTAGMRQVAVAQFGLLLVVYGDLSSVGVPLVEGTYFYFLPDYKGAYLYTKSVSCLMGLQEMIHPLDIKYIPETIVDNIQAINTINDRINAINDGLIGWKGSTIGAEKFNYAGNTASGNYSHAEGVNTTASGRYSHAEGDSAEASHDYSHAEGHATTASGMGSHAEGYRTIASGHYTHAEGEDTNAVGRTSHAEGSNTTANGGDSHAEGANTTARAIGSHAEGYNTTANGVYSHAEGSYTTANGSYSHAEGHRTIASSMGSHAEGKYNIEDIEEIYVHMVGNGYTSTADDGSISTTRSNAHTLDWEGNAWYQGAVTSSGADYAEFFEWEDGNPNTEDRVGHIVTLHGDKIALANPGDTVLGIISGTAAVLGDNAECAWKNKYLTDKFGRIIYDMVEEFHTEIDHETGEETQVSLGFFPHPRVNPEFNPDEKYVSREDRPEWDKVGMFGKIYTLDDGTCVAGGYGAVGSNGVLTHSEAPTNMYVMKRTSDDVVLVLLR